jgi:hypothetical protein
MKKSYLSLLIFCLAAIAPAAFAQTTFTYTGSFQTYTVPAGMTLLKLDMAGGQGGNSTSGNAGGKGGRIQCNLTVTPGQVLRVYVGAKGQNANYTLPGTPGVYNGGGQGTYYGGSGGGATDIRVSPYGTSNRIAVAGAGGGAGAYCGEVGADAGGSSGANGIICGSYDSYSCGAGGTQTAGGAGAASGGSAGGAGYGGACAGGGYWYYGYWGTYYYYYYYYGGGGGSGYYGGGGGQYGCGGGGSSYPTTGSTTTFCSSVTNTGGFQTGNGYVTITPPTLIASPTSLAFGPVTTGTTSVPPMHFELSSPLLVTGGSVTITPPANFTVSMDGITWYNSGSPLSYTYSGSTISPTNVYVRFTPTASGSASGNIVLSGGGAASVNVAVTGTGVSACTGTPTAGTAVSSSSFGGTNSVFTLSLTGTSSTGGLAYQWQVSTTGTSGSFTNITGAITPTYTFVGIPATRYFQCVVTCPSGSSATSSTVTVAYQAMANSSCTPNFSQPCSSYPMNTSIALLNGISGTSLQDPSTGCSGNYMDMTSLPSATLNSGSSYTATINTSAPYYYNFGVQVWIDFNDDGTFQTSESVGGIAYPSISNPTQNTTLTIPSGSTQGRHRMRIVGNYQCCGNTNYPSMNPCPTTSTSYGNVRDYQVFIGTAGPIATACTGTPVSGITSSTPTSSCSAFNPRLFTTGHSIPFTGLSYQWQSSTTSPTSGFTDISGATGQGHVASISSVGVVYYRQTVKCGASTATTIVTSDTFLAPPSAITGPLTVCPGTTTTLSSATPGGTWSASNANVTIGSTSGIVTGVTGSTTSIITYTAPSTCFTTAVVTINPNPAAIGGNTGPLCPVSTMSLTDATSGGVWSSSNTAQATINSTSGVVTGVAGGSPTITYTLTSTGCFATTIVTVQPMMPITGAPTVCNGYSTTLGNATAGGGTWSSSNTAVATITSGGVVSGLSVGTTTISFSSSSLGCVATVTFFVTNAPTAFTVTGGGARCIDDLLGVTVGVGSSNSGISYQLYNGATPVGSPITGAGFPFNFPPVFAAGTYGVVANPGTPCALTGTGTVNVTVNPLPTPYAVSGGGAYCSGTGGVHVYLNSSQINVNYQLFVNTGSGPTPVGSVVPGTSASLDFGLVTTAGTYTVEALNTITGCDGPMSNSVAVSINALPTAHTVGGGGSFCSGGIGVFVTLNPSTSGVNYQLLLGGVPVTGTLLAGTGGMLTYGPFTTPGAYTIQATNTTTGCVNMMTSTATISVNSLPTVYTVTGGGAYCAGTTVGVGMGVNGSQTGVNYQLYRGTTPVGTAVAGTGGSISFPNQTVAGSYTVIATNPTTSCTSNMFGSASVVINPQPTAYTLSAPAGNSYCVGGTGVNLVLSSSEAGVNYQLLNGATVVGAAPGTGSPISFGMITAAGTYTVVGTVVATGCVGPMSGSVSVVVNPLPNAYNVTVTGGGAYCSGGTGQTVGLSNSQTGVTYQLYLDGVAVTGTGSSVTGTGSPVNFGLRTVAGSYTVVGTMNATGCTNNMTGSAIIIINPTPVAYIMTGGGGYCAGTSGAPIGLSGSDLGVNYQLFNSTTAVGSPVPGIGSSISFGAISAAGTAYNVVATNTTTGCTRAMSGMLTVTVNALPAAYAMTGGGNYCIGGPGVPIGLANSATGINYQLYRGIVAAGSPVAGTGSPIGFGNQTVVGTYTVKATNATTGCMNTMTGSLNVGTDPLPAVFTVMGGGNYCAGGTGVEVTLNGSVIGTDYQLYLGGATVGSPMPGTGGILNFGLQTGTGTYTVVAVNTATMCTNNMAGSAVITSSALPATYIITGGGNYCSGGAGLPIGLSGSATGIIYQLNNGSTPAGAPVAGTGGPLSFGMQTAGGSYNIVATNTTTGCSANMTGSASVVVNTLPTAYPVTGGGNYCPGGTGSAVGLGGSNTGVTYQLYRGATAVGGPVPGTGAAISFGLQTVTGNYTVVANNPSTTCSAPMTGGVTVGLNTLPAIYNVTGGGNYCPGGSGTLVGVSSSSLGVDYQLYLGGVATGLPIAGTGSALSFGLQTGVGTYTVKATNTTTGCSVGMSGTAVITVAPLPVAHTVTGGGNYCTGGIGVHIGLAASSAGVYYQLWNGMTAMGSPMAGTGASIDFGLQTMPGTYTVTGTSTATTCTNTMAGSVIISVDPLPAAYTVTGGGNYCTGGAGLDVMLSNSDVGTDYQLYVGATAVGSPMPGTGAPLNWGLQTTAGIYTVVATDATTMCNSNMTGSVTITVDPLPTAYNVTGGGNYCSGGTGVHVMLSGSDVGTQYQLMIGGTATGAPMAGTGFALDFGLQTAPGSYTISAMNMTTTCTDNMAGSVNVVINALPALYTVSGLGSSYCAGGPGINVSLSGSDAGVTYQLYNGMSSVGGPVAGTGLPLNFGYLTATGTYTVKAVNNVTGCANTMAGAASISINPLPVAFTVTGGGSYCNGGAGLLVGLSSSNVGVSYQLFNGTTPVGMPVTGTGAAISFGLQTNAGTYTVKGTSASTTCMNTMTGAATVVVNALPASFAVTGGGNYCSGGTGVNVGLGGSALGINYQLWRGGVAVGASIAGTGMPLNFGLQTTAGTYTVVATNAITSCNTTMTGSAVVAMNTLPTVHGVIGGGNYCPGGAGVHIGLGSSTSGIAYQLYNGSTPVGAAVTGTGTSIDFGAQTMAGTYTVVATNTATGCTNNMTGSTNVGINTLPAVQNVVGGGSYCAGGTGANIGLSSSSVGISYQVYNMATPSGAPTIGTGSPLNLGPQTAAGTYTVIATDLATTCTNTMSGSATVSITPVVSPVVTLSTGVGDTVCNGSITTFTAMAVNGGSAPAYQWTINGSIVGIGSSYSYIPLNGDVVGVTLTSSAACAMPATASTSMAMTVNVSQMPAVSVAVTPSSNVCEGTLVTYTATPSFGGSAPTYSWIINGVNTASTSMHSYTPANGDVVYVVMNSNYRCRLANTATSTHVTMDVDAAVLPVVSITANPGANIAAGQTLMLTATATGAGSSPTYQWFVNSAPVSGANTPTFTSNNFVNGDIVSCEVTSSGGCTGLTGTNSVTIHVAGVGVQQVTTVSSDIKLIPNPNKGTFTVKGTLGITADEEVTIEVTNMLGQAIYNSKVETRNGEINEKVQLSNSLANGMYVLTLRSENVNKVFHIVVEQ